MGKALFSFFKKMNKKITFTTLALTLFFLTACTQNVVLAPMSLINCNGTSCNSENRTIYTNLVGNYTNNSAYVCVNNNGMLTANEVEC